MLRLTNAMSDFDELRHFASRTTVIAQQIVTYISGYFNIKAQASILFLCFIML